MIDQKLSLKGLCIFTAVLFLGALGCNSDYERPSGTHDLGEVRYLLFNKQHHREQAFITFRDDAGWAVMSTRCTYKEGCDLTYLDETLECSCCGSIFSHTGEVLKGPASKSLPYYQIRYADNHLYAYVGTKVAPKTRYTTPEIETAIVKLREMVKEQEVAKDVPIPEILINKSERELGPMFREYDPKELDRNYELPPSERQ